MTEQGTDNYLHKWMSETCSIYHLGIIRLGVTQVVLGIISMALGGALMAINKGGAWAGIGLWTGFPCTLAGGMCLAHRRRRPRNKLSMCTMCCLGAVLCAGFSLAVAAANIVGVVKESPAYFPNYDPGKHNGDAPLLIINALLLLTSPLSLCIGAWSAATSVGMVCSCCNMGRESIFTIRFSELDDDVADLGPSGPDIVNMEPFSTMPNGAPVLQLCYLDDEEELVT